MVSLVVRGLDECDEVTPRKRTEGFEMNTSSRAGILGAAILCAFAATGGRYDIAAYM